MHEQHRRKLDQALADSKRLTAHIETLLQAEEPEYNTVSITFDQLKDAAKLGWLMAYKIHFNQE